MTAHRAAGRPWRRLAGTGGLVVLASGCAERQLITAPETAPTAATWTVVWVAVVLAAVGLGAAATVPAWRARSGARAAVMVLGAHAGGVLLGAAVLVGAAVRSWQLIDRAPDAAPEPALLRLSSVDGDTGFFALMVLIVVAVGGLLALLLALAARYASTDDPVRRGMACGVLAVEILLAGYAMARFVEGERAWPYVVGATQLLLAIAAFIACWPRHPTGTR